MTLLLLALIVVLAAPGEPQTAVEKEVVVTITSRDIDNGSLAGIAWDDGTLLMQGAVANPDGSVSGRYVVLPARGTTLKHLKEPTEASIAYWDRKAKRISPTGLGRIDLASDQKMPLYGVGSLETRINEAVNMGGMSQHHIVKLGALILNERDNAPPPYDGELWSWSPAEVNRIAYVDAKGDLWIARADGANPQRVLKGHFTLPAWSDDGKAIAIAERKGDGRKWEICVIMLPEALRTPDR